MLPRIIFREKSGPRLLQFLLRMHVVHDFDHGGFLWSGTLRFGRYSFTDSQIRQMMRKKVANSTYFCCLLRTRCHVSGNPRVEELSSPDNFPTWE